MSTGKNDAENYLGALEQIYKSKNYLVKVHLTNGAHDFENWNGQLEVFVNYFFP